MELVLIPAGEFMMGTPKGEEGRYGDEGPRHKVRIGKPLYMGKYQVTQEQWRAVMGSDPSYFKGDDLPVEQVSWEESRELCRKLSAKAGCQVGLPSEAEWEYACRAGSQTRFSFGDSDNDLGRFAWYGANSEAKTHPVGTKEPNAFGLYDMHGNVWEWCEDVWHGNYEGAPGDGSAWTSGGDQSARVLRGGSWITNPRNCRAASRYRLAPDDRDYLLLGFRVAMGF